MTEGETVGWPRRLNQHKLEQTPGDSEEQGTLTCCSPWGPQEWDTTEQLNNNRPQVAALQCASPTGPSVWIAFPPSCQPRALQLGRCSQSLLHKEKRSPPFNSRALLLPWGVCQPQLQTQRFCLATGPRDLPSPPGSTQLLPLVTREVISWLVLIQHQSFLDVGAVSQRGFLTHIFRLFWGKKQRWRLGQSEEPLALRLPPVRQAGEWAGWGRIASKC